MRDPRNADEIRRPTLVNGEIFEKTKTTSLFSAPQRSPFFGMNSV